MNNVANLSSEYATVNEKGEVVFEKEGEKLCLVNTEVLMLRNGSIIFNGTDEKLRMSSDPYVTRFIRGERKNLNMVQTRKTFTWSQLRVGIFVLFGLAVLAFLDLELHGF